MIHVYCYNSSKTIIISDRPSAKVIAKYGRGYEILTSIRERDSIAIIVSRLVRNYGKFVITEWLKPIRPPISDETRAKMAAAKIGKSRPESSNRKASITMKGKSNFRGKKHSEESKKAIAAAMAGNDNVAGLIWCYDPVSGEEKRIASIEMLPRGWLIGREYYSMEPLLLSQK